MDKIKIKVETEIELEKEDLIDILDTAVEGGIGYWACLDNTTPEWILARKELKEAGRSNWTYGEVMYQVLIDGNKIKFEDAEDYDDDGNPIIYELDKTGFENGIKMTIADKRWTGDPYDVDAEVADCIIQYGCFDDIVFG